MALEGFYNKFQSFTGKKDRTVIFAQSEDGEKQLFMIDSTPVEEHELSSKSTEFPIEKGAIGSDHVQREPRVFRFDGLISDNPFTSSGFFVRSAIGLFGAVAANTGFRGTLGGNTPSNLVFGGSSIIADKLLTKVREKKAGGKPSEIVFRQIEEVYEKSIPCKIVTNLRVYENMNMEQVVITKTPETANALAFRAVFKQITVVRSEVTDIKESDTVPGNSKFKNRGNKPLKPTNEQTQEKAQTAAFRLGGAATSRFFGLGE